MPRFVVLVHSLPWICVWPFSENKRGKDFWVPLVFGEPLLFVLFGLRFVAESEVGFAFLAKKNQSRFPVRTRTKDNNKEAALKVTELPPPLERKIAPSSPVRCGTDSNM